MQIIRITNKNQLNNFVGAQKHSQFLQSWEWGEFHKIVSSGVWRLVVAEDDRLVAAATIIKKRLPMGKYYFYCPRGPVFEVRSKKLPRPSRGAELEVRSVYELLFNAIKKIAEEQGVMFLRFEPVFKIQDSKFKIQKTLDIQPSKTLILDLAKTEDELLKNMHQKTRYNIRLAEKKEVKVIALDDDASSLADGLEDFWKLLGSTSERDTFRTHGLNYYKSMLELDSDFIKLFIAEYQGKSVAANIVSFFGNTVTYMHGASSNNNRNVMAPYLLQWHVIKFAKKLGYKYYDFYGADEEKWPGVTRFKKGFGGEEIKYPGTFDLIFDSGWYNVYKMVRRMRRTF